MANITKKNKDKFPSIFSDFFNSERFFEDEFFKKDWMPAVNVKDNEKDYTIDVALPGYQKDDLNIEVDNGLLSISAEVKDEQKEQEDNFTRKEFSYRSFKRKFSIPEDANAEQIEATYKDGVLQLKMGKKAIEANKKTVDIN